MLTFNHENSSKTRRSILLVCVSIIAAENYIPANTENVFFEGFALEISKYQLVDGLCIGLLYLWFVLFAQLAMSSGWKAVDSWKDKTRHLIHVAFTPPDPTIDPNYEERMRDDPAHQKFKRVDRYTKILRLTLKSYWTVMLCAPVILLTGFVWMQYNGLFRVLSAVVTLVYGNG